MLKLISNFIESVLLGLCELAPVYITADCDNYLRK